MALASGDDLPSHVPSLGSTIKTVVLAAGANLIRVHRAVNGPIWFGPAPGKAPSNRFDAPNGEYRALYCAERLDGAFVESILHGKVQNKILTWENLNQYAWTEIRNLRPFVFAKLYAEGLLWHGVDAGVSTAKDYSLSRELGVKFHAAHPEIDGIAYYSRHDNSEICLAIYDRAQAQLSKGATCLFPDDISRIKGLAAKYGAVIVDNPELPPL